MYNKIPYDFVLQVIKYWNERPPFTSIAISSTTLIFFKNTIKQKRRIRFSKCNNNYPNRTPTYTQFAKLFFNTTDVVFVTNNKAIQYFIFDTLSLFGYFKNRLPSKEQKLKPGI